jgi:hypothetical protein
MEVVATVGAIADHVRAMKARPALIGIDGVEASGKTTLAFDLAHSLGGIRIGLDSYVDRSRDGRTYVDLLRLEHLKRDLTNLRGCFPFTVVDGVCLLSALELVGFLPHLLVYAKKHSPAGLWNAGFDLENFAAGEPAVSWLETSVLQYHLACGPDQKADIHYHWSGP